MFLKSKLRRQIKQSKETIAELEQKRSRSQAALVSALLKNETPNDEDVDYFNRFSELIDHQRDHLHELMDRYDALLNK